MTNKSTAQSKGHRATKPTIARLRKAADNLDWLQVSLVQPYGPPCFHFEPERGKFCLRAKPWFGHGRGPGDANEYASLADLMQRVRRMA